MKSNADSVLVVAKEQCLLSSTLTELFKCAGKADNSRQVDSLEQAEKFARSFGLVIIFTDFPLTNISAKFKLLRTADVKVLLVLRAQSRHSFRYFRELDFHGFISETSSYDELRMAINMITVKNRRFISQDLLSLMSGSNSSDSFVALSRKELEIAEMVLAGGKNKDIAGKLKISEKTVSTHKSSIFKKLDIASEIDLLKLSQNSEHWMR